MRLRISVVTPTCDRPVGLALAERMMARQSRPPDEWIVADGGSAGTAVCMAGQLHVHTPTAPGVGNFLTNVLAGVHRAAGDLIVLWEDDDYYAPNHLELIERQFLAAPQALAAGDDDQRYYNIATRQFRTWKNVGACLCQTGIRRNAIPKLEAAAQVCAGRRSYGLDTTFWRSVPTAKRAIAATHTVVGLKGLPGRSGLGVGHRPDAKWTNDPEGEQLRRWVGADADMYLRMTGLAELRSSMPPDAASEARA